MAYGEILSEEPITLAEVKKKLEAIKKRDEELTYRSGKTHEYLKQIPIESKKTKKLMKAINELEIPRVRAEHVVKIVDMMPKSVEELKIILQGFTVTVSADNMKKILSVLSE